MDKNISLELPEMDKGVSPMEMSIDSKTPSRFPHFHYEGPEELPIPDEGCMTVKYKIVWKQEEKGPRGEEYRCKVELQEICEVHGEGEAEEEPEVEAKGPEAPTKMDHSAEEALDAIAEALAKARSGEGD